MKKWMVFNQSTIGVLLACVSLILCWGTVLAGVTGKVAGTVKDAAAGQPLIGANMVLVGTSLGAVTDPSGHYFIVNIPPGIYSLKASMMGFAAETRTEIRVNADRTVTVNFSLNAAHIEGEAVTVTAEREIVPMDISASQIVADIQEIKRVPLVNNVMQYINLQAGIENNLIRGGGLNQTGFMMDGLMMVDNRANKPMVSLNLSSVKELTIIKGGFNPEYGNVRSGLINVITKEGDPKAYHGSADFRLSPAHLKHSGVSLFNPDNYYLRPYLDPAVMWEGTANGSWNEETKAKYPQFPGWDAYASLLAMDDDPKNDLTPEQARDLFLWQHRAEGSGKLGQKEGRYGDKPDWNVDASFGGPIPLVGKHLGDLSFFASYRLNKEMFGLPTSRDYFAEDNGFFKLTSRITPNIKLGIEGTYGETRTVAAAVDNLQNVAEPGAIDYVQSGEDIFYTELVTTDAYAHRGGANLYWPSSLAPYHIYRTMQGITLDHVLSPSTFYNLRITNFSVRNFCSGPGYGRDTTTVRYFGNTPVDHQPYGFWWEGGYKQMADGMLYSAIGAGARDWSKVHTFNVQFDLTSQIDKYNQTKTGFVFNYDDLDTHYEKVSQYCPGDSWVNKWRFYPYRVGAYVQDKLEFQGMIANFGFRMDYNEPNCKWFTVDRYSPYFAKQYKDDFTKLAPAKKSKGHIKISPRLGVSHPISANAKLYFNYGHFYQMPNAADMYQINYGISSQGILFLGNPSAFLPKTVAYELGFEYNIADMFLVHLAGYYKDVADETGAVTYTNIDQSVNYSTVENTHYSDTRGFELRVTKNFGRWIIGWVNYNYMVTTNGYVGREFYYQDPAAQRLSGLRNPYQEVPHPQPYVRANVTVTIPSDLWPKIGDMNPLGDLEVGTLFMWKSGRYETWDPLNTYQFKENLHWKAEYNFDLRVSKRIKIGNLNYSLFADVQNLLNTKYLNETGFANGSDRRMYMESLHLPQYKGAAYQARGYTPGNDTPGDLKSKDKPYINMPDREFLTYLNPRSVVFGLTLDF